MFRFHEENAGKNYNVTVRDKSFENEAKLNMWHIL